MFTGLFTFAWIGKQQNEQQQQQKHRGRQMNGPSKPQQLIVTFTALTIASAMANEIVDEPFISCSADAIYAKWKTSKTFVGHVSVRHAPNHYCYQVLVTNKQIELLVPHLDCQVSRIRSLNPRGVIIATSVLISFHPTYVTAGDRVYLLKCLHTHAPNHSLLPGTVVTDSVTRNMADSRPSCEYRLSSPTGDDNQLTSVMVGDLVRHRWTCRRHPGDGDSAHHHERCLLVTNCFLMTSNSEHHLIDAHGCSKDTSVLPELSYLDSLSVEQNVSAFGIAQKPFVHFQCQLNLFESEIGVECPKPKCKKHRRRRDAQPLVSNENAMIFDALSQEIEIVEPDWRIRRRETCDRLSEPIANELDHEQIVCITPHSFTVIISSTIFIALCTTISAIAILLRSIRCRQRSSL